MAGRLRRILYADAGLSTSSGLLLAALAGPISDPLGLPDTLLRTVGILFLPWGAFVLYTATCREISRVRPLTLSIGVGNVLWSIVSLLVLVTGWVAPTMLGYAFVIAQAILVTAIGVAQFSGLRKLTEPSSGDAG